MISILYMTIDRYPQCVDNLARNLRVSGIDSEDVELLWADNGSTDPNVVKVMRETFNFSYTRISRENEGIARTLNQLIIRSRGNYIVQLGNDYAMPDGWLAKMVGYAEKVPMTGMVGIAWCDAHKAPLQAVGDTPVHVAPYNKPIFGVKLKTRHMLDEVGAFDEMLHPYGLEDSDYHQRSVIAGFQNYYIPNLTSKHLGSDVGERTPYRLMKDASLKANGPYFMQLNYARFGYYRPWPAKKTPY